jgi:cell wall-associated NlpC family hydrolase
MLSSCAFPVRPGYDRRSGSYKRYRVPTTNPEPIDTTAVDPQEELVQEERLAVASKNSGEVQANAQDSTGKSVQTNSDSAKVATGVTAQATEKKVADSSAKTVEKQAEKKTDKTVAKKTTPTQKQTKRTARPTNLEKYAKEWLGAKYVYGAASKKKTDCSGYVMQVYKGFYGISLDHSAQHIYDDGRGYSIKRTKLQEGDLVFFGNFWKISHVGIYLKGNRFIHASTSKGVVITSMDDNYWSSKYKGARRFK